ncbi:MULTISPECIES: type VII toxin-antitoxin system HepT family RNase toxin [unclassified Endozoicomonas]|uniref:type VII toxin-antitoxin system HepT family RNase toxin n=1 Tax=unclassified Endozoicomonas TaxID=2644528 RepID=UPI003BB4A0D6
MDDVILNKYSIIQRCLARIEEEYVGYEDELTTNFTRQDSIILNIQRASQAALDLANLVIRLKQLGIPQGSRDSFSLLSDHGYVPLALADSMMRMIESFSHITPDSSATSPSNFISSRSQDIDSDLRQFSTCLDRLCWLAASTLNCLTTSGPSVKVSLIITTYYTYSLPNAEPSIV